MDVRPPIPTAAGPLDAALDAVPSKSVTHRALVAAALADGSSEIRAPLDADDTRVTRDGLIALGIEVRTGPDLWTVVGCGSEVPGGGELQLRESGTSMRLLTAVAALGRRRSRLDGAPRLRERPMDELGAALAGLGAEIRLASPGGGLPLETGGVEFAGGRVSVPSGRSSQFASALLLVAPRLSGGLELVLEPPIVSLPYVEVTARVLEAFGADVRRTCETSWVVSEGPLRATSYRVEGDHSSASYFLAAAAVVGGRVRVRGLDPRSAQPDARFATILDSLGCAVSADAGGVTVQGNGRIPAFDLDMGDAPDVVPTLAALGLFADGPCRIRGVAHLRHKESDRLELLARNLRALGREAQAVEDRLEIGPSGPELRGGTIETASDHRMAMAFAVAGLRIPGVLVDDHECVAKSNPRFWEQLAKLV